MKTLSLFVLVSGLATQVWTQEEYGYVGLGNYIPLDDIDAPVYDVDCVTRLEGPAYLAQFYLGSTPDSLSPVGLAQLLGTGDRAGYIQRFGVKVPGSPQWVYVQLRAWETDAGASFEAAVAAGGKHGFSNLVRMITVPPPAPPNNPIGLESFCLVPEPSTSALGLLGLALFWVAGKRRPRAAGGVGSSG